MHTPKALLPFVPMLLASGLARAEITVPSAVASTSVQAMSGVFDFGFAAPLTERAVDLGEFTSEREARPAGPFPAFAVARQQAHVTRATGSVSAEAHASVQAMAPRVDDPPLSNLFAEGQAFFSLTIQASTRASFSISVGVSGGQSAEPAVASCFGTGDDEILERTGRNISLGGTLQRGGGCTVGVVLVVNRNGNRDFLAPGEASGTFTVSVQMTEADGPEDGDEFVWIGGPNGDFGNEENWDPEGVPSADDTAIFSGGPSPTVDLASQSDGSGSGASGAAPVEISLERTRVNLDPVRPEAGVLRLLSPALDDPSLVVNSGGRLLLDVGSVSAQAALIGQDGLGTVEVSGPNLFQTDRVLVLGRNGEGRLHVFNGGNALSDEVVMGEDTHPGNAIVSGPGALWIANTLRVSRREPSTVLIERQGELDTSEARVDLAPQGELPNVTVGDAGTWKVDRLSIDGKGVVECTSGRIETNNPAVSGEIVVGSSVPGTGRLLASDGCTIRTNGDLVIGRAGNGRLTVDGTADPTTVIADGALRIGDGIIDTGDVVLRSDITTQGLNLGAQALDLAIGSLTIGHAARADITGAATVGRTGNPFGAALSVLGNGPPEVTEMRVGANLHVTDKGRVTLRNAKLIAGSIDIDAGGELTGEGSGNVVDAVSGILNHGTLAGPITLAPGTFIASGSTGFTLVALSGGGSPAPISIGFARRGFELPALPPASGVVTFEGDGEVAGTLVLQFQNGFAPRQGEVIQAVRAGGTLSGGFSRVEVRGLASGASFDVTTGAASVTAVALSDTVALPSVGLTAKPVLKEKKRSGSKVKVTRDGDTSSPMLVSYAIRGTARNGFDYEMLPGIVEIPAGKRSARIVVRPFADGLEEGPETIELEIMPGADYAPSLGSRVALELQSTDGVEKKRRRRS